MFVHHDDCDDIGKEDNRLANNSGIVFDCLHTVFRKGISAEQIDSQICEELSFSHKFLRIRYLLPNTQ